MARPREFDIDDVLARAMQVFWLRGFEEAALPDLLAGMGITRGSFYKAYGDKRSLFQRVLRRYEVEEVAAAEAILTDGSRPGRERLATLLGACVDAVEAGDRRGCLLCSAIAGPAVTDAQIRATVADLMARMRAGFLAAGGEAGRAEMLLTFYVGLRVGARAGADAAGLRAGVDAVLSTWTPQD